jgi:hypothetical protein
MIAMHPELDEEYMDKLSYSSAAQRRRLSHMLKAWKTCELVAKIHQSQPLSVHITIPAAT